jgi:hypothetical protein
MHTLLRSLTQAGKELLPVTLPNGTRLLLLPQSGRLLGLHPDDEGPNFLWTNPALALAESAKAYFARTGWANPGGDRTWLAPEIELFIGDVKQATATYAVQPALDPGRWTLTSATATDVSLASESRVRLHRQNRDVGVRLTKQYRMAANPLSDVAGLQYAGYTLVTTLEVEPLFDLPVRLGIWNLLQLPQPGAMLIQTDAPAHPRVVFGEPAAGELMVAPNLVRWNMAPPGGDTKISLKPQSLTGRAGHLREARGICDLVVREFAVGAECDYVDALWEPPHEAGWAFQACCVRNGAECFNELEYHVPAATNVAGRHVSRDESRVWAFRGPKDAIDQAARLLLAG